MEEPTVPTTPSAPVAPPVKPLSRKTLLISGAVALVVIVLIAAAVFIKIDGRSVFDRLATQKELKGILVAGWTFDSITPHSFGFNKIVEEKIAGVNGVLGDYAASKNVAVGIVTSTESGHQEVWSLGSEPKVLAGGEAAKASVAVSTDGTYAAYAAIADGTAAFSPQISSWAVHLLDLESGKDIELGTGFDPEFFMREGIAYLLFTSPEGVVVSSLASRDTFAGFITPFTHFDRVDHTAKVSPDGMHIALKDIVTSQFAFYSVYRVATDLPLGIEPVLFPENSYGDVIFANGAAYGIDNATKGTATVKKIDLTKTTETALYTFSTTLPNRFLR